MIQEDNLITELIILRKYVKDRCNNCAKIDVALIRLCEKLGVDYGKLSRRIQKNVEE
jgi:hypothetical protein